MPSAGAQPGEEVRSVGDGSGEDTSGDAAPSVPGAVAALCLIQFIDVLGVTVVVTALPDMLADVGGSSGDSALVATGYAMFFGGLLMFGARLGDRIGHRRTILPGIGSFAARGLFAPAATRPPAPLPAPRGRILRGIGSFAAGALSAAPATPPVALIAARCVRGAAAAPAVPSALRLLTTVTPAGRDRARAVAAWSAAGAAAGAAGFVAGGLVTDLAGWRVVFWGLLAGAAGPAPALPPPRPGGPPRPGNAPLDP